MIFSCLDISLSIRHRVEQLIIVRAGIQYKKGADRQDMLMPLTTCTLLNW